MKFSDFKIDERILKALGEMNFTEPTEIQARSIPALMEGNDLIGQAMTGSGKTAAFGVPLLHKIEKGRGVQALVLAPTRELAVQISGEMKKFAKHVHFHIATVYGGVGIEPQFVEIKRAEIVVGTPGRILDHLQRGSLRLDRVIFLVLDEADRMLDMGFIDDVERIIRQTSRERQTMLFSATIPDGVARLAQRYMRHPIRVRTEAHVSRHLLKHYYYEMRQDEKMSMLLHLIEKEKPHLALVFCATRTVVDAVAEELQRHKVEAKAIHGGLTQARREEVLSGFHRGRPHILVATDVAARGLDIKDVSHVFNYDIPKTLDDYTHRIGRTARIGKAGKAVSLLSKEDHEAFRKIIQRIDIEKASTHFRPFRIPLRLRREHRGRRFGPRRGPPRRFRRRF